MKVLITGGAGYIGTQLAIELNKNPKISEIIIYDNLWKNNYNLFLHSQIKHGKIRFIEGELLDSRKLQEIVKNVDIVYHLAARVAARLVNASHHLYEQINNWGTAELIYAVEKSNVQKFVYLSSIAVYGDSDQIIDDQTIPMPRTYYGASKLRGEEHVKRLLNKIDAYILRAGNVYGYGVSMRMDTVINKFMFDATFSGKIKILGDGKQKRGFIHIDKIAKILENIISSEIPSGIYNAVEKNLDIIDLSTYLKEIFPDLEMLFVNQHLKLRNIEIKPNKQILKTSGLSEIDIKKELETMRNKFFNSSRDL